MREAQLLIVENLEDKIDQTSGVSLDEEMANMVQFQHAYEATAKYIQMVQEMLDALISIA